MKNKQMKRMFNRRGKLAMILPLAVMGWTATSYAITQSTTGTLYVINSLGTLNSSGSYGISQSPVRVQAYDASSVACFTGTPATSVAYGTMLTIPWTTGASSATNCRNGIHHVVITPLANSVTSLLEYAATTTVATAVATGALILSPPTNTTNMLFVQLSAASSATATVATGSTNWGVGGSAPAANTITAPAHDASNGALTTSGNFGIIGTYGVKAEHFLRFLGVIPNVAQQGTYTTIIPDSNIKMLQSVTESNRP